MPGKTQPQILAANLMNTYKNVLKLDSKKITSIPFTFFGLFSIIILAVKF